MRVVSDHALIMLDTGEDNVVSKVQFHFEKQWLLIPNSNEEVFTNIVETFLSQKYHNVLDVWKLVMS
jgi:hypothetical protein